MFFTASEIEDITADVFAFIAASSLSVDEIISLLIPIAIVRKWIGKSEVWEPVLSAIRNWTGFGRSTLPLTGEHRVISFPCTALWSLGSQTKSLEVG